MDRGHMQRLLGRLDWLMVGTMLALLVGGVLFVLSATHHSAHLAGVPLYVKQLGWVVFGAAVFLAVALYDYHRLREAAWPLFIISVVLLALVWMPGIGSQAKGANRWLSLFGQPVQPSELAKITSLLVLARFLARPGRDMHHPRVLLQVAAILVVPFVLIFMEPDLGSALVLLPVALAMLYVAGVPLRYFVLLGLIALLLAPVAWLGLAEYQRERVLVFWDPGRDTLHRGWNKIQAELAVGSGGWLGKGFMQGTQYMLGYLPEAHTDFIYSVIAEEVGFVGCGVLLLLYAVLLFAGLRAAEEAPDLMGRLLAVGVSAQLFCHAFVNIAMNMGLLPIVGIPLPLVSYGGSFMVTTMVGLGLVQSVYVRRYR